MPRGRPKGSKNKIKTDKVVKTVKTVKTVEPAKNNKKTKIIDHKAYRTYVLVQKCHLSERHGYQEEFLYLFGKDEDLAIIKEGNAHPGDFLRIKNFISVPKGRGKSIKKIFHDNREFKEYLKEIEGEIISS